MTPEQWQTVRPILESALELDAASRGAFLDRACPNLVVRREVESLLASHEQADTGVLAPGAMPVLPDDALPEPSLHTGKRIGAYEILEEIAVGGMGAVYRAVRADGQYRQEVALKTVRADLSSELAATRFRNERQILASLDHPNIAKILDGGATADGVPYLVMEFIHGLPVTEYCDKQKLSIDERLKIFRTVCSAVHYAHQHLVIHRDLKPSNIFVTADGSPKLLDFGIAKILDPNLLPAGAAQTAGGPWLMTPEYASPEQLRGDTITTATDVYSLGLLLYQLLAGHRAYRFSSRLPHEIARTICETDPEKPSAAVVRAEDVEDDQGQYIPLTPELVASLRGDSHEKLQRRLMGDLDNIVMKALRKDPRRRYNSVDHLAEDIRRHLEGLTVSARQDTFAYRTSKFITRHRFGVAAAAVTILAILSGFAATLYEAHIARAERTRAEQRFVDVRELAKSNLYEFNDAIQNLPGAAPARHLVIQRALQYLDKLSGDAAGDRTLMHELAAGYERIASLQGNFSGPGIGDSGAALSSYQKAWSIRESLAAAPKGDVNDLKAESTLLANYVQCLILTGRTTEALRMAEQGIAIAQVVAQRRPQDHEAVVDEARARLRMSMVMGSNGSSASTRQLPEAITQEHEAIKLLTQLAGEKPDGAVLRAMFQANVLLAYHLRKNREFEASLRIYEAIWSMSNGLQGLPVLTKAVFYNHRSRLWVDMGKVREALDDDRKAVANSRAAMEADTHDLRAQIANAQQLGNLGLTEARLGSKAAGKKKLDEAMEMGERLFSANPYELFYKSQLLLGLSFQGEILSSMDDEAGAEAKYSQALKTANELAQNDPGDLESRLNIAKLHAALGVVLARTRLYSEARQEFSAAIKQFDDLLRIRPQDADALYVSKMTHDNLTAMNGCVDRRACDGVRAAQLPFFNN